jgi:hypothetical protein
MVLGQTSPEIVVREARVMKYLVSDLQGALLDAAVAKASGIEYSLEPAVPAAWDTAGVWIRSKESNRAVSYSPTTSWDLGGPIIEREDLYIYRQTYSDESLREWVSGHSRDLEDGGQSCGPTPLIAAMRAFVGSKLGDEVKL